jgi:hypothetical protein
VYSTFSARRFASDLREAHRRGHLTVVNRAPEVEVPTRIVKQLLRLEQGVALVRHLGCLTDAEFAIMRKVALDSVPLARKAMFNDLMALKSQNKGATVERVAVFPGRAVPGRQCHT